MRCGGSCSDCKDVTRGLEVRKSFGWINVSALPVSSPHVERHTSSRRAPTQAIDQDHPLGPRASRYSKGSTQSERSQKTPQSERPQKTPETTEDHCETSPSTIHGRHAEDDRDRKLQELTATVEELATVIEHMSKKQLKTEPVELKPKQRSRITKEKTS